MNGCKSGSVGRSETEINGRSRYKSGFMQFTEVFCGSHQQQKFTVHKGYEYGYLISWEMTERMGGQYKEGMFYCGYEWKIIWNENNK